MLQSCLYTVTVASGVGITSLTEAVPVSGTVGSGNFDNYAFTLTTAVNITFSLTVLSGDPDAYIGNNAAALPNNTWGSYNVSVPCCVSPTSLLRQ